MAQLDTLVVLDGSARHLGSLAFGFERAGCRVLSAASSEEAVGHVKEQAQLLVVALGEESAETAPLTTIARLREEESTRTLPIVVLGDQAARDEALRAGADEFVRWPAFIRDVITLCKLAVSLRGGEQSAIDGLLEDYGLYFLTRALSNVRRSGILELERLGRRGEVHFSRGEVVSARVGSLSGTHAFHHLLLWGEAQMRLRLESPTGERKINLSIDQILESGAEFAREFERLADKVGGAQAVFTTLPKVKTLKHQIPDEVFGFLRHLDGRLSVIDVVEDSPFKPFDTLKVIYRLLDLQAIARVDVPRSISPLTAQLAARDRLLDSKEKISPSMAPQAGSRVESGAQLQAASVNREPSATVVATAPILPVSATPPSKLIFDSPTAPKLLRRKGNNGNHLDQDQLPTVDARSPRATTPKAPPAVPASNAAAKATADPSAVKTASDGRLSMPMPPFKPIASPPATKLAVDRATEVAKQETPLFDELEESFFASATELSKLEPVENFDDLDANPASKPASRSKWSLFRSPDRRR